LQRWQFVHAVVLLSHQNEIILAHGADAPCRLDPQAVVGIAKRFGDGIVNRRALFVRHFARTGGGCSAGQQGFQFGARFSFAFRCDAASSRTVLYVYTAEACA
jgi:hypothetical protein